MRASAWHMAVLIPARDEEDLLPRCLRSVQQAREALPAHITSDVVLVSDSSGDRTAQIAREILGTSGAVLTTRMGVVGSARALAARVAMERYDGDPALCWLANTDADCEVPEDWLLDHLAVAASGTVAVAGIVDVDSFAEHEARVERLFRETYRIDADGSHPHVHGANLGVRADAYLDAGGWLDLVTAEDHDLWRRLQRHGARRVSDASLHVVTSGRRSGRAPAGFAEALAAHNEAVV